MHHVILERWSRGSSSLHRRDPRAKIVTLLVLLVALSTTHRSFEAVAAGMAAILACGILASGIPIGSALLRAAVVLPFSLAFALFAIIAGEPRQAMLLAGKSYLSALAVLLLVSTTPLPELLHGLGKLGVPRFLLLVTQFLYRYLFVLSAEVQHMRIASASRGRSYRAAAGAIAMLFARAYGRAEIIHHAMLARGFRGDFPMISRFRFTAGDALFTCTFSALAITLRIATEVFA
jgi:cobalt/nickel transport system permease protein